MLAIVALVVATIAAAMDVRTSRIPDALTFGGLGVALGHALSADRCAALYVALSTCVVVAACAMLPERVGRLGGGDVKLMGSMAALLGAPSALAAGIVALVVLRSLPARIARPAGPAVLAGVFVVVLVREVFRRC